MSRLRYASQTADDPGWDGPRIFALLLALVLVGPMLLLGGVGLLTWRWLGVPRRWVPLVLLLSLVPAALAIVTWSANPLVLYGQAHLGVVLAAILWLVGRGEAVPPGLTLPLYLLAVVPAMLPGAVLTGCALAVLLGPRASPLRRREATGVVVPRHVETRAARGVNHPPDGWALGYRADGQRVVVSDKASRQHVIVCGATGAGKTTVLRHLLDGVARRCPVVLVDCKASPTLRRAVAALPNSQIWTIGGATRWDALRGDPTCFASKLLAAEQFGPNAAIYRAAAERYVQWVGWVLDWTGTPRDPHQVGELLAPKAFAQKLRVVRAAAAADWWEHHGAPLQQRLAELGKAEGEGIAGFAARFGVVAEGVAGPSLGVGAGAIILEEAVRAGSTVLFSLDAASYPTLAAKLGAWVLLDLVRVAGLLQEAGWGEGEHPCYVVLDEFSALRDEGRHVVPLLARAREAGIACVVATQGLADLARVDRALPQQIIQNTAVRVLLRQGSAEDAFAWARHGGELEREELSRRTDSEGRDLGEGYVRWQRDFHVRPEELQVLGTGEAVVQVAPIGGTRGQLDRVRIAQPRITVGQTR
jgi:hypothetical protein